MGGKQQNFRRNGSGNSSGQTNFGRGNSFGRNNRNANDHRKRGNFQRYGTWENNNRFFNNSKDNEFGASANFHQNDENFSKFRDLEQRKRRNSGNNRGRGRNNWHGGGGNNREGAHDRYGEQRVDEDGCDKNGDADPLSTMTVASVAPTPGLSKPLNSLPISSSTPLHTTETNIKPEKNDAKPLTSKIKLEKLDHNVMKKQPSPSPSKSSSKSSSTSSSSSSKSAETTTEDIPKTNHVKTMVTNMTPVKNSITKSNQNSVKEASSSSNTSSSEEESSEEETPTYLTKHQHTQSTKHKVKKGAVRKVKKGRQNLSSEEDLVCLGRLEKKFIIEDDELDATPVQNKIHSVKNACILCDKLGHTAFQCQMVCKNCGTPYHNLKSCPQPANLAIMMQYFMEFCMTQMNQFNPEQKFVLPQNVPSTNESTKRKRRRAADQDEDEEEDVTADESTETESNSDSDSSEPIPVTSKNKNKRVKTTKSNDGKKLRGTFSLPQFPTFPTFGASPAAYNPLLFGQMMQSAFPPASHMNFK